MFNEARGARVTADRNGRDPEGYRQLAVGCAAGVRRHCGESEPTDRRLIDRGI